MMKLYTVQMTDGIKVQVNAFNYADALRAADRKQLGRAFGSRAIGVIGEAVSK